MTTNDIPARVHVGTPEPLQRVLDDWRVRTKAPGVSISIRRDGAALADAVSGVANLESGRALRSSDRFHAASVTKLATAAAALRLIDQGRLDRAAPISKWFPTLPQADRITVDMLLTQRSGVPEYMATPEFQEAIVKHPGRSWPVDRVISTIERAPRPFEPGAQWGYSNSNYQLLGRIVAAVGGGTYEQVLEREVLGPAGVAGAVTIDRPTGRSRTTVHGYALDPSNGPIDVSAYSRSGSLSRSTLQADGALVASAPQLARLGEAILRDGGSVLSDAARAAARVQATSLTVPPPVAQALALHGYGPGMWSQQVQLPDGHTLLAYGHGGDLYGEKSLVLHDPVSGVTIAEMVNAQPVAWSAMLELAGELFATAGTIATEKDHRPFKLP